MSWEPEDQASLAPFITKTKRTGKGSRPVSPTPTLLYHPPLIVTLAPSPPASRHRIGNFPIPSPVLGGVLCQAQRWLADVCRRWRSYVTTPKDIIKARKCHRGLETRAPRESMMKTCFVQHVSSSPSSPNLPLPPPQPSL